MNEVFKKFATEARDKAWDLYVGVKNTGYNGGGVDIRDYWKFGGPRDLAYMCHAKALRAISVTDPGNPAAAALTESVKDTAVDLMNYAMFLYAETCCREEDDKAHMEADPAYKAARESFMHSLKGTFAQK